MSARVELDRATVTHYRYAPIAARRQVGQVPTGWLLTLSDNRERRVYVLQYGNGGGAPFVMVAGVVNYLSADLQRDLERHLEDMEAFA